MAAHILHGVLNLIKKTSSRFSPLRLHCSVHVLAVKMRPQSLQLAKAHYSVSNLPVFLYVGPVCLIKQDLIQTEHCVIVLIHYCNMDEIINALI